MVPAESTAGKRVAGPLGKLLEIMHRDATVVLPKGMQVVHVPDDGCGFGDKTL